MPVLDQLSFSDVTPKRDNSPIGRFRRKIIEAIDLQIAMAEAHATGVELKRTRHRWITNDAGVKEQREVPVRLRPWWWTDDAATTFLSVRYGGRAVAIAPGKTAIEVGAFADLAGKLAILRDAVRAGELDGCLAEAPLRGLKKAALAEAPAAAPAALKKASRKAEEGARAGT